MLLKEKNILRYVLPNFRNSLFSYTFFIIHFCSFFLCLFINTNSSFVKTEISFFYLQEGSNVCMNVGMSRVLPRLATVLSKVIYVPPMTGSLILAWKAIWDTNILYTNTWNKQQQVSIKVKVYTQLLILYKYMLSVLWIFARKFDGFHIFTALIKFLKHIYSQVFQLTNSIDVSYNWLVHNSRNASYN